VFPFEELSIHAYLRNQYGMDWEIGNYAFGAAERHPFLSAIIDNCVRSQNDPQWVQQMISPIPRIFRDDYLVLDTTGPGLVSRTLAQCADLRHRITVLFPENVCDSDTWHRFGRYGIHLQAATWRNPRGVVRRRLARYWESRTRARLLKQSLALGARRSVNFGGMPAFVRKPSAIAT
jgi:hypothetical protein